MRTLKYSFALILGIIAFSCDDGIVIPDAGPVPTGSFILQVDSRNSFRVNVAASSSTATDFFWDFGDGVGTGRGQNSNHTYSTSGTYTITLTLLNKAGIQDVKQTVTVTGPETPVASFSLTVDDANAPLRVVFNNASEFGATYLWEFGDGQTSTQENPTHTYARGGLYSIRLVATGTDGQKRDSERREIYLIDPSMLTGATEKSWALSTEPNAYYVTNPEGQVIVNSTLLECELNDRYVFAANGTYRNLNQGDARLRSLNFACGSLPVPASQFWSFSRVSPLSFRLTVGSSYIGDAATGPAYVIKTLTNEVLELRFDRKGAGDVTETVHMKFVPKT